MSKKVFVGNLPFSLNQDELVKLVAPYGKTEEVTILTNKFSGRSRGFGFVTFENDADADKAIAELNNKDIDGRPLKVTEATPLERRDDRNEEASNDEGSEKSAEEESNESEVSDE